MYGQRRYKRAAKMRARLINIGESATPARLTNIARVIMIVA